MKLLHVVLVDLLRALRSILEVVLRCSILSRLILLIEVLILLLVRLLLGLHPIHSISIHSVLSLRILRQQIGLLARAH